MNTSQVYAELSEDGKSIEVFFSFDRAKTEKMRKVFGSKFRNREYAAKKGYEQAYYELPLDLASGVGLRDQFGDELVLGTRLRKWGNKEKKMQGQLGDMSKAETAKLKNLPKVLPKLNKYLRSYQKAGAAFAAYAPNPLIADQPGLGKTVQSIAALFEAGTVKGPNLIVCPKVSMETVWARELKKHQPHPVWVAKGNRAARDDVLADFYVDCVLDGNTGWLIVNPQMVAYRRQNNPDYRANSPDPDHAKWLLDDDGNLVLIPAYNTIGDVEWSNIIIDEAHKNAIRNPQTMTAKGLYDLEVAEGGKKIALSGTPMDKPIQLWGTLHWLHPERFTSRWKWAEQWLEVSHNGYGYKIGRVKPGMMQEFNRSLTPYLLRRTKKDVFAELPDKQYVDVWVDMDDDQMKQYAEFKLMAMLKFEDEEITATSILTELLRLKQIAIAKQDVQEEIKKGEKVTKLIPTEDSCKLQAVENLLDERGILDDEGDEKVVIFTQFKEVAKMMSRWLTKKKVKHHLFTGDTSQENRIKIQDEFQADGGPRVIVMTMQSGGMSITLDKADTAIFTDEMWSPSDMEQAEDRLHRVSRIHNVTCYYIRTTGTIDEKIRDLVKGKADVTREILDDRRYMEVV